MTPNVPRRRRAEQVALSDRFAFYFDAGRTNRIGDLLIASILIAITFPLAALVALAIKYETSGPVLVWRACIGRGGRRFQMLRFRTTIYDPEQATPAWAQQMTRVGQFIRETRIDALPQLINVFRGQMSIIDREARSPSFLD